MKRFIGIILFILLAHFLTPSHGVGSNGKKDPSRDPSDVLITFAAIPGGTFQMGDEVGNLWSGCLPVHTVTLSGFEMCVYKISNVQYAAYLNNALASGEIEMKAGDVYGKTGEWAGEKYLKVDYVYDLENECWINFVNGTFTVEIGKENWPVVAVTWYGAKSFALYYGLDLPTEAEWEYAARGGKQFKYGTNDGTINSGNANFNVHVVHPTAAGVYPPNPFGLCDLSGNVWEWCNDWYGSYPSESVTNPTGAQSGRVRIIRQGAWDNSDWKCRTAYRGRFEPDNGDYGLGFRVVLRPKQ